MNLLSKLEHSKEFWFLLITSLFFFLLRLPSLFEPYWYGDEGIYQVLGLGIRNGRLLYQGIWDNKPPLLYMVYALFNSDQFLVRGASLIAGLLAILFLFKLSKKLFISSNSVFATTAFFAFLFGLPLIEGNIANAENFMLAPIILAGYLIYKQNEEKQGINYYSKFFFPGLLLGIAFLFKIVAVFDFAAFGAFIVIVHFGIKKIGTIIEILIPYILGFATPIVITLLFFFIKGGLSDFIHAALVQNVGYVGYSNNFIIPQGFLILKLALLSLLLLFFLIAKNKFTYPTLFIFAWLSFSLFDAFFSGRPYTHYVLVTLPPLSLLIGLIINEQKLRLYFIVAFLLSIFLLVKNFTYFGKTIFYYQNYISFVSGKKTTKEYYTFFDRNTPRDYEIAQYLKTQLKPQDNVFIWGDDAQLYKLIYRLPPGRYTVAYHMRASQASLKETQNALEKEQPKFVVINSKEPFPFPLIGYSQAMTIDSAILYEHERSL